MFDDPIVWQRVIDHRTGCQRDVPYERLKRLRSETGAVLPAFEAWLLQRSLRTLVRRFRAASHIAQRIAERLSRHAVIESALCPGLPIHPTHPIARQQKAGGMGGMLAIRVRGCFAAARHVTTHTRSLLPATSFSGVERLIEHRKSIEGPGGLVPDHLLRLSVGIERADDLIADLDQAEASPRG